MSEDNTVTISTLNDVVDSLRRDQQAKHDSLIFDQQAQREELYSLSQAVRELVSSAEMSYHKELVIRRHLQRIYFEHPKPSHQILLMIRC
jgi:hypothetical protein